MRSFLVSEEPLPVGKLPAQLLANFLHHLRQDASVLLGPGIGRDAAVIRIGTETLVLKSDPITFATDAIGWYALHVNANDIACLGADPKWFLATVLLPEHTTPSAASKILEDLAAAAEVLGVTIVGGHTEITAGLDRPLVAGTMVGTLPTGEFLSPARARPGDAVLLVRGIAIEGTALLARECRGTLSHLVPPELLERCQHFLIDPGISIVSAARLLRDFLGSSLHYLHDPTEGGLATGLHELATACATGIVVQSEAILIYPETQLLCQALELDPLGLIASGALLAVVSAEGAEQAVTALTRVGIPIAHLGWLDPHPQRRVLRSQAGEHPLPSFAVDEVARFFASGRCS